MSSVVTLRLPHPPSVNHYWRHARGRHYISADGKAYRRQVCALVARDGCRALSVPAWVEIAWSPPDRRRRDIDNVLKALLDALGHAGLYVDDSQIHDLRVRRVGVCDEGGHVVVTVGPLPAGPSEG